MKIDFTFTVLVYNHADYIIEHLESIKYQILNYGKGLNINLVVSDDGSKDSSVELINTWLAHNSVLFSDVTVLGDGVNRGVGKSFTSMWEHIGNEPFKLLAGDDVYSYENIFEEAKLIDKNEFVTGLPLLLVEGELIESRALIMNIYATQHIYENSTLLSKIKGISVINTPSLIYQNKFIKHDEGFKFIRKFRVTEDFPMMAFLSSIYDKVKFLTVGKVYVYYRRTSGSIYLVANEKYNQDKEDVFKFLESIDPSAIGRFMLRNRLFCYRLNGVKAKLLNLNYYAYLGRLLYHSPKIIRSMIKLNINSEAHSQHYQLIVKNTKQYMSKLNKE
ncbi:glycosyltransferase family 2 protein [Vibrio ulleungensis]|uniref:Glycosyltransferase family 2 protein n=1 Tax=Vibrio ulleungensis TaxID=2807619 RepID=A0ABS2HKY8_9VIBR|nr:glycosyltransferase family 2 protein [Vibrio ulleungensis]MBM7037714.1 glycosyltransferase family 2 protein [Vibrio ulleungensis]